MKELLLSISAKDMPHSTFQCRYFKKNAEIFSFIRRNLFLHLSKRFYEQYSGKIPVSVVGVTATLGSVQQIILDQYPSYHPGADGITEPGEYEPALIRYNCPDI